MLTNKSIFGLMMLIFFSCTMEKTNKTPPKAVKGVFDLRGSASRYNLPAAGMAETETEDVAGRAQGKSWDFTKDGTLNLDGEWEFYWGELLVSNFLEPKYIPVPSQWQKEGNPTEGYATYRLRVLLPEKWKSEKLPESLSISMTDAGTNYEMFLNGKLAASNGKVGKNKSESIPYLKHSTFSLEPFLVKGSDELEIIVHVSNFHYFKGGLWNNIKLGSTVELAHIANQKYTTDLIVFSSLFIMGIYHLGLYLTRRKDRSPLYFGIYCLLIALRTISITERMILDALPSLPFNVIHKLEYLSLYFGSLVFMQFIKSLYPDDFSRKWYIGYSVIWTTMTFIVIFLPMNIYGKTLMFWQFTFLIAAIYLIKVLITAGSRKEIGAKLFLSGWIIFAFAIVHDILKSAKNLPTPNIGSYGLVTFVIFQATVLSRKFADAFTRSEKLTEELRVFSDDLEKKVMERTIELQDTLDKVQELKTQQDGDYFLTSLLLRPLNMNKATGETLDIEFFSSQKKKFQFKEWKEEIGGDICMANSIILKGKPFTVFVNADAMGKSLQGAGGALVLGSVFESIINRNKIVGSTQNIFPEKWIKDAFLELHHVFETFDGSMLVSLVFGLIEDDSGYLYMINAEHPWTILYRDQKASFINTETNYRKLGTLGADGSISIFSAQLFPGDVLILGSDGRDDVIIDDMLGGQTINEDETLILTHIEKTSADLEKIYSEIQSVGILMDDLTLVKITFKTDDSANKESQAIEGEEISEQAKIFFKSGKEIEGISFLESAIEHGRRAPIIYKSLFQAYLKTENYEKAANLSPEIVQRIPGDTEILFQVSYVLKKTGDYLAASDLGERVKLRNPLHIRNLINLSDAQYLCGNNERARALISQALELEPDNHYALKRRAILEGNGSIKTQNS